MGYHRNTFTKKQKWHTRVKFHTHTLYASHSVISFSIAHKTVGFTLPSHTSESWLYSSRVHESRMYLHWTWTWRHNISHTQDVTASIIVQHNKNTHTRRHWKAYRQLFVQIYTALFRNTHRKFNVETDNMGGRVIYTAGYDWSWMWIHSIIHRQNWTNDTIDIEHTSVCYKM